MLGTIVIMVLILAGPLLFIWLEYKDKFHNTK